MKGKYFRQPTKPDDYDLPVPFEVLLRYCMLCSEIKDNKRFIFCGHSFCGDCIDSYPPDSRFHPDRRCPVCWQCADPDCTSEKEDDFDDYVDSLPEAANNGSSNMRTTELIKGICKSFCKGLIKFTLQMVITQIWHNLN